MLNNAFITPEYESRCFADLPQTILSLFSDSVTSPLDDRVFGRLPRRYDTLIFFYIDAFGWRFFEQYHDRSPFLQRMMADGVVSKITSQFPSTTSAHVTTIHSGLPVGQSGIFEWQYYEPTLDAMFSPLLFSYAGGKRETLASADIKTDQLYPGQTLYRALREEDVKSYVFQHRSYTPSTFSKAVMKGAKIKPYTTLSEALINIQQLINHQKNPSYYFLYFDPIDLICHQYGPESPQLEAEIETFLAMMDRIFMRLADGTRDKTLFMLTTDHGQVEVHPDTTIYLNKDDRFTGFKRYIRTNQKGDLLVPGGSARDMFLYIKDDLLEDARVFFSERLDGIADVIPVQYLIDTGLFGPLPVSETFMSRVGNLVILPYAHQSVWWYEKGRFQMRFLGHHGGLTPQEMEIPLILYPMGS